VEVMARCSPHGEVTAASVAETGNVTEVILTEGGHEVPIVSDSECHVSSRGETDASGDGRASDNENSWMYYFGASTITLRRIKEMAKKGILLMERRER
jgi:hypothetical protein